MVKGKRWEDADLANSDGQRTRVTLLIADTFLVSAFTPDLILISEDLELGTTNEKELMVFVFPDMHYFT